MFRERVTERDRDRDRNRQRQTEPKEKRKKQTKTLRPKGRLKTMDDQKVKAMLHERVRLY